MFRMTKGGTFPSGLTQATTNDDCVAALPAVFGKGSCGRLTMAKGNVVFIQVRGLCARACCVHRVCVFFRLLGARVGVFVWVRVRSVVL